MSPQRRDRRPVEEAVLDLLHPDDSERAGDDVGPEQFGPSQPELLRFAWASAVLGRHPELLRPWALSGDRAIRRAVMRSPELDVDVAERIVGTRRSGVHTLGSNPATPRPLLEDNPSALRRRDRLDTLEPEGLGAVDAAPNRHELVEAGSGTVDLVMARSDQLDTSHAALLAARRKPVVDPWVGALLIARFGAAARTPLIGHAARGRVAAIDLMAEVAEAQVINP